MDDWNDGSCLMIARAGGIYANAHDRKTNNIYDGAVPLAPISS